jgi:hypothetical protein
MASIVPPLDLIPKLPGKAVDIIIKQIDTQTDKLLNQVNKVVQDSTKMPVNIKCDDPRVENMKSQLAAIQSQLTQVQARIPKIQKSIDSVKKLVTIAKGVKTAITVAQLSNPVTAPVFIATQLMAIQDATIVNAIASLNQFAAVPAQLTGKLQTIIPLLTSAISKLSNVCNGDVPTIELPNSVVNGNSSGDGSSGDGSSSGGFGSDGFAGDYNDLVATNFYNDDNVSNDDLDYRSITIYDLITQQRDLLTSLEEAPSKVYQDAGLPSLDLGKVGDYYIDTTTSIIYGPKMSITNWE